MQHQTRIWRRMETLRFLQVSTHFPPQHLGGDAVFVHYLSSALAERGHEVHILHNPGTFKTLRKSRDGVSSDRPDDFTRHEFRQDDDKFGLIRALMFGTPAKTRDYFMSVVNTIRPDVVHWHNTKGFINVPLDIPRSTALYTAHDYYAVCPRSNLLRPDSSVCTKPYLCQLCHLRWKKPVPLWRMGGRRVLRFHRNMEIISPCEFMANRLRQDGLTDITVIRNFVPDPGPSRLKEAREDDLLLYVGMLEGHKGLLSLVDAFHRTRELQGFRAVIVGDGPLRDSLVSRVHSLGLEGRVRITGFLPRHEVNSLVRRAALQVMPSEWPENAPLSALEALSVGTPILGSDFGGLPEILNADAGCYTYKGRDTESLSQRLVSIWESRDRLTQSRTQARKAYESRFTPEKHLQSYMRLTSA